MKFLLDTNVVSELHKRKPHGAVVSWLATLHDDQALVSAVTLGELQSGVERTRMQDAVRAEEIEAWVERLADAYEILPMDARCFRVWARLMHRKSDELFEDAMIAATASVHGLVVATRNQRDFQRLGVESLDPFKFRT
jgi:predicted nucleic acid-binding protein